MYFLLLVNVFFYETVHVINFNLYIPSTMLKRENKTRKQKKKKKEK